MPLLIPCIIDFYCDGATEHGMLEFHGCFAIRTIFFSFLLVHDLRRLHIFVLWVLSVSDLISDGVLIVHEKR